MAYCVVSDIQADFKSIVFAAGQNITDTAVTQFIVEAGALINSYVGTRFTTPVTGNADSLALMSLFCRVLVSDRIRGILANKQATNVDANANIKSHGMSTSDVLKSLLAISEGRLQLAGAALLNANASMFSSNFDRNETPRFRKNQKQW